MSCLLSFLFLVALTSCNSFRPSWISENYWTVDKDRPNINPEDFDGPLGGHFEGEVWVPDDPTIELTYKIPDISAGFIFDTKSLDLSPSLQIELLEFDFPGYFFRNTFLRYLRTWKLDLGVAYQRAYVYLGPRLTSIFEISIGGFMGWNWEDEELSYGFGAAIIKF